MIGAQTIHIAGAPVDVVITKLEERPEGWLAEAQVSQVTEGLLRGASVAWGDRRGFVSRWQIDTEMADVTLGPDWHIPALWDASRWREYTPGRTSCTITIQGSGQ